LTLAANQIVSALVATNARVLHFQVLNEFDSTSDGLDGRAHQDPHPDRFPTWLGNSTTNTKAFTSLDEYLLLKFMSENRLNGCDGW
jgi:hypothetical protein